MANYLFDRRANGIVRDNGKPRKTPFNEAEILPKSCIFLKRESA